MMPRNDEKLRGSSHRIQRGGGHVENKEHMGMGNLCCSNLYLYCRQLIERVLETSRGNLSVDRMSEPYQEWRRDKKLKTRCLFLHKSLSHWGALDKPRTYCTSHVLQKHLEWRVFQAFRFSNKGSGGTLHCCIQWGIG